MNTEKLFSYIHPTRFLDVGAHVGDFASEVKWRYPKAKVVMIEPNPACERLLRLKSLTYHIMGLSNENSTMELYVESSNPLGTGASFYKETTDWYADGKYTKHLVEVRRLDDCDFFNGEMPDFIKLDTQGSELDIINGGVRTISSAQWVLIETSLVEYNQGAPLIDKIISKMKELNFDIEDILEYHSFPQLYDGCIFQLDILFRNNRYGKEDIL